MKPLPRLATVLPFAFAAAVLAGCSGGLTSYVTPYRVDVRQGNFVTQEMVAQLKPGLTRDQVRFVLGTPLVNDVFHADRWDYVYRFQPGRGELQQRRLSVFFVDGKLARVAGDTAPLVAGSGSEGGSSPTQGDPATPSAR